MTSIFAEERYRANSNGGRYEDCLIWLTEDSLLEDSGFTCMLGFQGDEDILFYSDNYGDSGSFREARFPISTVERLIWLLPNADRLELALERERAGMYCTSTKLMHW